MNFEKRYLQFNELVFDGFDMISEYDEPLQFKGSSTPYSYGHGSYMPLKSDFLYVSERQVNMTISLKLTKVSCEFREKYVKFALMELVKPGRLWAIRGNEIMWAFARVNNLRPVNSGKQNVVEYDVEFIVPGGVWHKADKAKTFLVPYNVCSYIDCKDIGSFNPVANSVGIGDCCDSCEENKILARQVDRCDCCCTDDLTADMALGYHLDELQRFYSCDTPYQIAYDCDAAKRFNRNHILGQKICTNDCAGGIISGQFFSDTDIPTDDLTIVIIGRMKNPRIKINDNENIIKGEYDGILTIEPSGDVYFQTSECCEPELLDTDVWSIPTDSDYGWYVKPQANGIVINTNICSDECSTACVYIDHTAITI